MKKFQAIQLNMKKQKDKELTMLKLRHKNGKEELDKQNEIKVIVMTRKFDRQQNKRPSTSVTPRRSNNVSASHSRASLTPVRNQTPVRQTASAA